MSMLIPREEEPRGPSLVRHYALELRKKLQEAKKIILAQDEKVAESHNLIPVGSDES